MDKRAAVWNGVMGILILAAPGCARDDETLWSVDNVDAWCWAICDGRGLERPRHADRDHYTLVADGLLHPSRAVSLAAGRLATSSP